ncbi:MAG: hypothetical protein M3P94_07220 [Chloroflexota bacterium]|nr:hypothetical protein [Chloroflexota bacterium]
MLAHVFDLDQGTIADDIMDKSVDGMMWNMLMETAPDGTPWPALSDDYEEWKDKFYPGQLMSHLTGEMRTIDQLSGVRTVSAHMATMEYGLDHAVRLKAMKFSEGGVLTGTAQPPRPFYAFTFMAIAAVDDRFNQAFTDAVP